MDPEGASKRTTALGRAAASLRLPLAWGALGLLAGSLGWYLGGLLGSFLPRSALAAALTAAAFGLLLRRAAFALLAAGLVGAVSIAAYLAGSHSISPMLSWPAAALALGALGARTLVRARARVAAVVLLPLLASAGFVAGLAVVATIGMALDEARIVEELMLGGAAGFGLMSLGALAAVGRWLDQWPKTGRSAT